MSLGLFFVFNFGPLVHHDANFLYLSGPIKLENGTVYVILNFTSQDAFVAQKSMNVYMQVVERSVVYPNGTIAPFPHPLSDDLRTGSYNLIIIGAKNSKEPYPHSISNYTGAYISPSDYKQRPILQVKGNDTVIFPLAGDYTAYLLVTYSDHPELDIPLGKVMSVSPLEASLQVESNNISVGLSIIIVGLTIIQIGLALHVSKKHRSSVESHSVHSET